MLTEELIVSETFYSIQGEGKSVGVPAVFLRLAGCNLTCRGFSYLNTQTGEHQGCDTTHLWRTGERMTVDMILAHWEAQGWVDAIAQGAHVIVTGGEPVIQQPALVSFLRTLTAVCPGAYVEMESNATLPYDTALLDQLSQLNASPKLTFAGDPEAKRYNPTVIEQLAAIDFCLFKFVVRNAEDVEEVIMRYQQPFQIPRDRLYLMPEGAIPDTLMANSLVVVELCKQYGFRYSPRLHIHLWGDKAGV